MFIVPKDDIIPGFVFLDQVVFEYKRFFFGQGEDKFQAIRHFHHSSGFGGRIAGNAEIGKHPF